VKPIVFTIGRQPRAAGRPARRPGPQAKGGKRSDGARQADEASAVVVHGIPPGFNFLHGLSLKERAGQGPFALHQAGASAMVRRVGPVAQLDRALPSEGRGREFESRRVRQSSV
jgi:hypothetical protein